MKVICPISDFTEHVADRGKGKGNKIKSQLVLAVDLWNWIIGSQQEGKDIIQPIAYYGNFKVLSRELAKHIDQSKVKSVLINAGMKVGENLGLSIFISDEQSVEDIGKEIDDVLDASFVKEYPPRVYQRMFKDEENDKEDSEQSDQI